MTMQSLRRSLSSFRQMNAKQSAHIAPLLNFLNGRILTWKMIVLQSQGRVLLLCRLDQVVSLPRFLSEMDRSIPASQPFCKLECRQPSKLSTEVKGDESLQLTSGNCNPLSLCLMRFSEQTPRSIHSFRCMYATKTINRKK